MSRRVRQRHEHLAPAAFALPHVVLDDRVAAGEAVLVAQPLEHPLGRVPLLAVNPAIPLQPAVDDQRESVQLRPLHGRCAPVAGRNRERQDLADTVARDVEMPCRLPLAHAFRTSQPNLPIHVHGDDPHALPAIRGKDIGGRLLRRPQRAHPAATVADFLTAVLNKAIAIVFFSFFIGKINVFEKFALGRNDNAEMDILFGELSTA